MATQIKVANEAKQDITINKADQILGRLADQTIIAKTIKSIQRGIVDGSGSNKNSSTNRYEFATVSPVGDKCVLLIESSSEYNSSVILANSTGELRYMAELIGNKICSENVGGTSHTLYPKRFKWTLIEFY